MVDTGPTFFEGTEENENKQAGDHARMLRGLVDVIPGGPTVVPRAILPSMLRSIEFSRVVLALFSMRAMAT
jgi:hypothetical protein